MAHHAPDLGDGWGTLLPRSTVARAAVLLTACVFAALAVIAVWVAGGLAPAGRGAELSSPGTELKNDLFTVTLHDAEIVTGDEQTEGAGLQISADLVSHDTKPVSAGDVTAMLRPEFSSKEIEAQGGEIAFERHPDGMVRDIQPDMPEKVLLRWSIGEPGSRGGLEDLAERLESPPDEQAMARLVSLAQQEERVTVTVTKAEYAPGFTDQTERWFAGDENGKGTGGAVALPLGGG